MTSTPNNKLAQPFKVGDRLKLLSPGLTAKFEGSLEVQRRVTLTTEDMLLVMALRDTRTTPLKNDKQPSPTAGDTSYKVYTLRKVSERYEAGEIKKIKHIELSNDLVRKGNGDPSSLRLKVGDKTFLRTSTPTYPKGTEFSVRALASTAGSQGNAFGKVTSATPLKNIVYDGAVFLVKMSEIQYISDNYINHDQFRKV